MKRRFSRFTHAAMAIAVLGALLLSPLSTTGVLATTNHCYDMDSAATRDNNTNNLNPFVASSTVQAGGTDPTGSLDNSFGQGTNEDDPDVVVGDGSIPNSKADIGKFEAGHQLCSAGGFSNHQIFYVNWERNNTSGTTNFDIELNQVDLVAAGFTQTFTGPITIPRTGGNTPDILITYDISQGGNHITLGLLFWLTTGSTVQGASVTSSMCYSANALPCWGHPTGSVVGNKLQHRKILLDTDVSSGNTVSDVAGALAGAAINSTNNPTRGEAAIDLTAAGVSGGGPCGLFGSTFLKSRSSDSFTSEIKDFAGPFTFAGDCHSNLVTHPDSAGAGNSAVTETVALGTQIKDVAVVSVSGAGLTPQGSVAFKLFGPADATCTGTPIFTSTVSTPTSTTSSSATFTSGAYSNGGKGVDTLGTYRWTAEYTSTNGLPGATEACGTETVIVINTRINLTPLTATDLLGNSHIITATLESTTDGTTWTAMNGTNPYKAPDGTTITFSFVTPPSPNPFSFVGGNTCTTTNASCTVTINSTAAGTINVHATTSFSVTGVVGTFTLATNARGATPAAGDDAQKTWVKPTTTLSVTDQLVGLPTTSSGTVAYTSYPTLTDCQNKTNGTARGGGTVNGTAPSSNVVSIPAGTSAFFRAVFTGTTAPGGPTETFDTGCTESATSS